jgi:succinate dehydrogenase/fumarate reductase-like Fe-S protein
MSDFAVLVVRRGVANGDATVSRYEVPYSHGQSVLDGLRYVRAHIDPTLSIRYSCMNANTCKECMIVIDGKIDYACTVRLQPREMILEPLPNKPHLRDLVSEIAPPDERLATAAKKRNG